MPGRSRPKKGHDSMIFVLLGLAFLAATPADSAPLASYLCTSIPGFAFMCLGIASIEQGN